MVDMTNFTQFSFWLPDNQMNVVYNLADLVNKQHLV